MLGFLVALTRLVRPFPQSEKTHRFCLLPPCKGHIKYFCVPLWPPRRIEDLLIMDRALLSRATRATEDATPGYIYKELASMTFASPSVNAEMEDFLIKKLVKDDPYVKLKVLKIVKHVSENGSPEFRRSMQRKTEAIKQCLVYKGRPHPVRGDAPSREVREEANRCLKSLFGMENAAASINPVKSSGRIEGFGSDGSSYGELHDPTRISGFGGDMSNSAVSPVTDPYSGGGIYPTSTPSGHELEGSTKMTGFGNPQFDHSFQPTKSEALIMNLGQAAVRVLPDSLVKRLDDLGVPVSAAATAESEYSRDSAQTHNPGFHAASQPPFFGSPGFNLTPNSIQASPYSAGRGGRGYEAPNIPSTQQVMPPQDIQKRSADKGVLEKKIVDDICAPLGAKVCPPAGSLTRFCYQCENLDLETVSDLLHKKLQPKTAPWQNKLRVLYILEALVDGNAHEPVRDEVLSYMSENMGDTFRGIAAQHPQCRSKANKLLNLAGEELEEALNVTHQRASHPPTVCASAEGASLLDFDETLAGVVAVTHVDGSNARSVSQTVTSEGTDLLDLHWGTELTQGVNVFTAKPQSDILEHATHSNDGPLGQLLEMENSLMAQQPNQLPALNQPTTAQHAHLINNTQTTLAASWNSTQTPSGSTGMMPDFSMGTNADGASVPLFDWNQSQPISSSSTFSPAQPAPPVSLQEPPGDPLLLGCLENSIASFSQAGLSQVNKVKVEPTPALQNVPSQPKSAFSFIGASRAL
eukprot:GHVN01067060.1.p2 GENE.GHVN01067060.1~~GHVN01067060.1.p2  ORF type:complete len:751 (-),score=91.42 GHVN01067060.1:3578-5830(-)